MIAIHRSKWVLACAIALGLILGSWLGGLSLGGSLSSPATAPVGPRPLTVSPSAGLLVETGIDSHGFVPSTDFNTGAWTGSDQVYFYIFDPNASATVPATVRIVDPNASRDGLPTPVWQDTVNLTGGVYDSTAASPPVFYPIPPSLRMGGPWILNVSVGGAIPLSGETTFEVHTYYVSAEVDQPVHLPGDTATVFWQVLSYRSDGPVSGLSSVAVTGCYENSTSGPCGVAIPGIPSPSASPQGNVSFRVPGTANPGSTIYLTVWANTSRNGTVYSEDTTISFGVEELLAPEACASLDSSGGPIPCPSSSLTFPLGSFLTLRIAAPVGPSPGNPIAYVADAPIQVQFSHSGINESTPSGFPTELRTGGDGQVRAVLPTSGMSLGTWTLTVTVRDPENASLTAKSSLNLTLIPPSSAAVLELQLNAGGYFGGSNLTGSFTLSSGLSGNVSPPAGWVVFQWDILNFPRNGYCGGFPADLLRVANLSGTSGTLGPYTIGTSMSGSLLVMVLAHNTTETSSGPTYAEVCVPILPPALLVNPSELFYRPGDTITVSIVPEGAIFAQDHAEYFATVTGTPPGGSVPVVLFSGNVTAGSFQFSIPATGTLPSYLISVIAQGNTGVLASQTVALVELSGYQLVVGVATTSHYSDDSYQPGETITLQYAVSAYGTQSLPPDLYLFVSAGGVPLFSLEENGTSGSFSFSIPSSAGNGFFPISVEAFSYPRAQYLTSTVTGVMVESSPSVLDYELVPGSGVTVGFLGLVVVLILGALLAVAFWRRVRPNPPRGPRHFEELHGPKGEVVPPPPADAAPPSGTPPVQEPPKTSP